MKLTDLNTVRNLLSEFGASPDKRYGQNFLISDRVVENIAEYCGACSDDGVLEIGPGIGVLTQKLCEKYKKVVSVEIDDKMAAVLGKTMADYDNFTLIQNDILKTDLECLLKEHFEGMNVTVCANLPYYITSPIIMFLLESEERFDNITVMIQKEVAAHGKARYGGLRRHNAGCRLLRRRAETFYCPRRVFLSRAEGGFRRRQIQTEKTAGI